MAALPSGGRILDAGCGHGEPVIGRLLENGFSVSGIDNSPVMLQHAREKFPAANFSLKSVSELESRSEFDGVCSFSSLLYLDLIDLSFGLYQLHQALKPDGLLFLFACDLHADWRGHPLSLWKNSWVWEWMYTMSAATHALEKHGYFKVLESEDVTPLEQREAIVEEGRKNQQESYERQMKFWLSDKEPPPPPDPTQIPELLDGCYVIIAQKQTRS